MFIPIKHCLIWYLSKRLLQELHEFCWIVSASVPIHSFFRHFFDPCGGLMIFPRWFFLNSRWFKNNKSLSLPLRFIYCSPLLKMVSYLNLNFFSLRLLEVIFCKNFYHNQVAEFLIFKLHSFSTSSHRLFLR